MPTIITGMRDTNNINSVRRVVDMSKTIAQLQPEAAPLTVLLNNVSKRKCINPKFEWMEDDLMPWWDAINNAAGYAAGATSFVVDNGAYFELGTTFKFPRTGEVCRVAAAPSGNTLGTVTRSVGGTAAAAILDNEPILILGDSNEEGTTSRNAKTVQITNDYNYTQIFRTTVEVTGTEDASELYGGGDRMYQRKKKGIEHLIKLERAFWFGERSRITTGTHPEQTTGGVFEFISSNFTDAGGMLTEYEFEEFLEGAFEYGSGIKWAFCSGSVISIINMWGRSKLQMVPTDKTYGLNVTKYISPHGELNLVKNKLFTGDVYGTYMAVLDLEDQCAEYRFLQGRDTKLNLNVGANDADAYKDEYITEAGLQFKQADRHAVLYNITS